MVDDLDQSQHQQDDNEVPQQIEVSGHSSSIIFEVLSDVP